MIIERYTCISWRVGYEHPEKGTVTRVAVPLGLGKSSEETYIGSMNEVFLSNRALGTDKLKIIMKSFDVAFTVGSRNKLATCGASLKQTDEIFWPIINNLQFV